MYNCLKHEVATVESEHPEEGVYTLPITTTVKHMFSTYIVVKGLDQQKFSFFTTERSERVQKNVFFTQKYFRAFALVLRNSVEPAIVVFVFPRGS